MDQVDRFLADYVQYMRKTHEEFSKFEYGINDSLKTEAEFEYNINNKKGKEQ